MDKFVIWSDEILEFLKDADPKDKIVVYLGYPINCYFPITGAEDSQSAGWWEIRFGDSGEIETINLDYFLHELPEGFMVMIQEKCHFGKSYPIDQILKSDNGDWILKCNNQASEYWEELRKWKELLKKD